METSPNRGKILLHACCAPCAAPSAERLLAEGYTPTLFYSNPNIDPLAEWEKRLESLELLARSFDLELLAEERDHEGWLSLVKGYEQDPEGGGRCAVCFRRAIEATAARAAELEIPFFSTTLTLSPLKSSKRIFALGKEHPGFLEFDFKKRGGAARSVELSRELGLYRQNYCGCEFSIPASRR